MTNQGSFSLPIFHLFATVVIVLAIGRAASAQPFSGCGEIIQEQFCILFEADDGIKYVLDDLGGFDVGDTVLVEGTIFGCFSICFVDCIETTKVAVCPDPGIPGDLNGDGSVGVADLLILLSQWGPCADCGDCPADLDGDCTVGVSDLLILLQNWG